MLMPRMRQYKSGESYGLSFRWGKYGYDLFQGKGFKYVQYGKKGRPLKFLCQIKDAAMKPPMFLYSGMWTHHYTSKTMIAGETKKPIDVSKLWGN